MARTKQKVREEWEEKKQTQQHLMAEGGTDATEGGGSSSADAGPSSSSGTKADPETKHAVAVPAVVVDAESDDDSNEDGEDEFTVECIVAERTYRNKLQFEVKWEGSEETTWEPEAHLTKTIALEKWLKAGRAEWRRQIERAAMFDDEDEEGDDDDDEDDEKPRGLRKRSRGGKRTNDDSDYQGSDSEESEEDESDSDEYVPEGRRRTSRRKPKRQKREAPAKALNDRQLRLLEDDLAEVTSLAALRKALKAVVKKHPGAYATARAELKNRGPEMFEKRDDEEGEEESEEEGEDGDDEEEE